MLLKLANNSGEVRERATPTMRGFRPTVGRAGPPPADDCLKEKKSVYRRPRVEPVADNERVFSCGRNAVKAAASGCELSFLTAILRFLAKMKCLASGISPFEASQSRETKRTKHMVEARYNLIPSVTSVRPIEVTIAEHCPTSWDVTWCLLARDTTRDRFFPCLPRRGSC